MRDLSVAKYIGLERERQKKTIELIASENYASADVLNACGSILTNKYAEGYPGARHYGGCEYVDEIEKLAIERCKKLFGGDHVNVQPHSGSQANMAVYNAILSPGDTILGMGLKSGGHLTHGSTVSSSGKLYKAYKYSVNEDGYLDYDEIKKLALDVKPKLIIAGASAYPRAIDFRKFREIADEVGAYFMVDMAHIAGLVAAGLHMNPVPYADFVTSTTHKTLRGPRGGFIICKKEFADAIDKSVFPGIQGGPLEHIIAAKAICFYEALQPEFVDYQKQVISNCKALCESLNESGLKLVTNGSDNHLVLVDTYSSLGITGKEAEERLGRLGITCNKNTIPHDPLSQNDCSGIRLGTPAMTTRGCKESDFRLIGKWIASILKNDYDEKVIEVNIDTLTDVLGDVVRYDY